MPTGAIERSLWIHRLKAAWAQKPIVWLAGVRRVGKTHLSRSIDAKYFNCDLPSTQKAIAEPEVFLRQYRGKTLVLDEIHQIDRPELILKIAADEFPGTRILATGSSTLSAGKKFRDTLTDRKRTIHLVPLLPEECHAFGSSDLRHRLLRGGLPPAFLSAKHDAEFYAEWLDSFFARDIQELFSVEKRTPFLKVLELALAGNGTPLDPTRVGQAAGVSRPTATRYLDILEATKAITPVRPFAKNATSEIISQPRIYGFDTGFCAYVQGWDSLHTSECGALLENLTLETLQSLPGQVDIRYWRTKQGREIDFVLPATRDRTHTIECKWSHAAFSPDHVLAFRKDYPGGKNWVVCSDVAKSYDRAIKGTAFRFVSIWEFRQELISNL